MGVLLIGNVVAIGVATIVNNLSDRRQYPTYWGLGTVVQFFRPLDDEEVLKSSARRGFFQMPRVAGPSKVGGLWKQISSNDSECTRGQGDDAHRDPLWRNDTHAFSLQYEWRGSKWNTYAFNTFKLTSLRPDQLRINSHSMRIHRKERLEHEISQASKTGLDVY
jgi:hypothetical protein